MQQNYTPEIKAVIMLHNATHVCGFTTNLSADCKTYTVRKVYTSADDITGAGTDITKIADFVGTVYFHVQM